SVQNPNSIFSIHIATLLPSRLVQCWQSWLVCWLVVCWSVVRWLVVCSSVVRWLVVCSSVVCWPGLCGGFSVEECSSLLAPSAWSESISYARWSPSRRSFVYHSSRYRSWSNMHLYVGYKAV
ncbi:hypothetical protein DL89DRAFT_637, partial [Linderina pennispora]